MLESRRIKRITGHGFRGCLSLCLPKFADVYQWDGGIEVGLCEVTFGESGLLFLARKYRPDVIISHVPITIPQPGKIMGTSHARITGCRCTRSLSD